MKKLSVGRKIGIAACLITLVCFIAVMLVVTNGHPIQQAGILGLLGITASNIFTEDTVLDEIGELREQSKQEDLFVPLDVEAVAKEYVTDEELEEQAENRIEDLSEIIGVDETSLAALISPENQTTSDKATPSFDITYANAEFKMDTASMQVEEVFDTDNINGEAVRKAINMIAKEFNYSSVSVEDNDEPIEESVEAGFEDSYCAYATFDNKDKWLIECCGSRIAYSKVNF